jgi:hypothetical protein
MQARPLAAICFSPWGTRGPPGDEFILAGGTHTANLSLMKSSTAS